MTTEDPYSQRVKELMERISLLEKALELKQAFNLPQARAELERLRAERDALWDQHESWWEDRYGSVRAVGQVVPEVMAELSKRVTR